MSDSRESCTDKTKVADHWALKYNTAGYPNHDKHYEFSLPIGDIEAKSFKSSLAELNKQVTGDAAVVGDPKFNSWLLHPISGSRSDKRKMLEAARKEEEIVLWDQMFGVDHEQQTQQKQASLGSFPLKKLQFQTMLHLSESRLTATMGRTTETLASLSLANVKMTPAISTGGDPSQSCLYQHPSLTHIHVAHSMLPDDKGTWECLMSLLQDALTCPNLESVNISLGPVTTFQEVSLGATLPDMWLPSLRLKHLKIDRPLRVHKRIVSRICNRLYAPESPWSDSCCCMKRLHMMNQATIRSISTMLAKSNSLQTLSLPVWLHNVESFATALTTNRSLQSLQLHLEEFRVKRRPPQIRKLAVPEKLFCNMLEENHALQHLVITGIPACVWESGTLPVNFLLRLNRAGRKRLLSSDPPASDELWLRAIISCKDETDLVYFFLSQNPALLEGV
ncbi:expressed unknown protein [Seminavis robusta]|uniref:Uncharacterized protein n=1 Tax=Seminavis robusta TaxID=568900 RepID=A0A9N8EAE6_9STRA|nr:expressed unknown protein [Seminavis robusta]|eukprot:Sro686_g187020.1 n/a (449) ;mRNA; f:7025-8371